ncbi:MAG: ATP-binding protein [Elusimicrobia bacterium]|nr:ATP-binding protein [Elusimicrobiota bacterium]
MLKNRYLAQNILSDLREKMVFIGGPRQVGKTTLAKALIGKHFKNSAYYNWDNKQERRKIMASDWQGNAELIILDEIHKYKKWKRFIKGEYDALKERYKFIITGSARLDIYRKSGDSLQGRYHYYRLHPFSIAELLNIQNTFEPFTEIAIGQKAAVNVYKNLEKFGGFPEPFIAQNERALRRWQNEKIERLFREDIRDVEIVRDINSMKLLSDMLPSKIGSLLSVNSIREDLEVSHRAVSNWLNILESFYYQFRIYPFSAKVFRSLKKEPKLYLWDWSEIENEAARFENIIASHLLKFTHFLYDWQGYKAQLYFLRDTTKRETDFLVTVNNKPWFAIEVKTQDTAISPNITYFSKKLNIPYSYQVIKKSGIDRMVKGIRIISADKFLTGLI